MMLWVIAGAIVLAPLDGLVMTGSGTCVVWRPWRLIASPFVMPDRPDWLE